MTFTGALSNLGQSTLDWTTAIILSPAGLIITGLLALGIVGLVAIKFRHIFGMGGGK